MAYSKTSWFNKPSVASPINATNLNKIENGIDINSRYITATAGSDGDFHINIASYTTLTAGLKLNITFPTATVPTANARLSIDGGTTYKNIVWDAASNSQMLASYVQSQKIDLVYDGTDFRAQNASVVISTIALDTGLTGSTVLRRIGNHCMFWYDVTGTTTVDRLMCLLPSGFVSTGLTPAAEYQYGTTNTNPVYNTGASNSVRIPSQTGVTRRIGSISWFAL